MRKLLTATLAALTCLAVAAVPAPAKLKPPKAPYTYTATIDCGSGPVVVGSYDDLWADLEELDSRRRYKPVEWHVMFGSTALDFVKPGKRAKRTVACSYDDGGAKGTVVVKRDHHFDRADDDRDDDDDRRDHDD